jgi:hypothetical protein
LNLTGENIFGKFTMNHAETLRDRDQDQTSTVDLLTHLQPSDLAALA